MTSEELNTALSDLSNKGDIYECWPASGKAIPYFGWWWRDVNFDHRGPYPFGTAQHSSTGYTYTGFMENNKWGHKRVTAPPDTWLEIKQLCEDLALDPTKENFQALHQKMQSLGDT